MTEPTWLINNLAGSRMHAVPPGAVIGKNRAATLCAPFRGRLTGPAGGRAPRCVACEQIAGREAP